MSKFNSPWRRRIVGFSALALLLAAGWLFSSERLSGWVGSESTVRFLTSAMARIGLVLGGFWFAWDSLKKPARWIPPGIAVVGLVGVLAVAVQPKLILAVLPLLGGLTALAAVVRVFR